MSQSLDQNLGIKVINLCQDKDLELSDPSSETGKQLSTFGVSGTATGTSAAYLKPSIQEIKHELDKIASMVNRDLQIKHGSSVQIILESIAGVNQRNCSNVCCWM